VDEVEKFLHRFTTYVRNPGLAIRDFVRFVADSWRLMGHVSKPGFMETYKTSVIVLIVVAFFVGLLHVSDLALFGLRSLARS
jgi:preprotein translocase subunit SecE